MSDVDSKLYEAPPLRSSTETKPGSDGAGGAWFCVILALGFAIYGVIKMMVYSESDKLVGGDAYNYSILAERGIGFICVGIVLALVGVVSMLHALLLKRSTP